MKKVRNVYILTKGNERPIVIRSQDRTPYEEKRAIAEYKRTFPNHKMLIETW